MRHNDRTQNKGNYFDNIATGTNLTRENWGATVDEVYTISPTSLADVRFNFTRMNETHGEPSEGFNPTALGYPSYISANSLYPLMPYVQFGSCGSQTSFQCPRQQRIARSIAVLPDLRRSGGQGQWEASHPEVRRRYPAIPVEHVHHREFRGFVHVRKRMGPFIEQRLLHRADRPGFRFVPDGSADGGAVRYQLPCVLSRRITLAVSSGDDRRLSRSLTINLGVRSIRICRTRRSTRAP